MPPARSDVSVVSSLASTLSHSSYHGRYRDDSDNASVGSNSSTFQSPSPSPQGSRRKLRGFGVASSSSSAWEELLQPNAIGGVGASSMSEAVVQRLATIGALRQHATDRQLLSCLANS